MILTLHKTDGGRQSSGWTDERKDCTVRSLAVAADISYDKAHDIARRSGRKNGKGWYSDRILHVAQADGLLEFVQIPSGMQVTSHLYGTVRYRTLAQIVTRFPTGRYIVTTSRHAMALIDGVIHDRGLSGARSRVCEIFEVKPKATKPAITQAQVSELWARLDALDAR